MGRQQLSLFRVPSARTARNFTVGNVGFVLVSKHKRPCESITGTCERWKVANAFDSKKRNVVWSKGLEGGVGLQLDQLVNPSHLG